VKTPEEAGEYTADEASLILSGRIAGAKASREVMGRLVKDYMPFIKKCAAAVFSAKELREEYAPEAMLGFLQSVRTYREESGAFIPYVQKVIRNRLLNASLKEARRKKVFLLKKADNRGEEYPSPEIEAAQRNYELTVEQENLRAEIAEINAEFSDWDFGVSDLAEHRPKQDRSRLSCQKIAQTVCADAELAAEMKKNRKLPIKKITALTGCSEKLLEKYRRYIIALILIMDGDYPYIRSFLPGKSEETP
jgi:RNA polymerase sigma factor